MRSVLTQIHRYLVQDCSGATVVEGPFLMFLLFAGMGTSLSTMGTAMHGIAYVVTSNDLPGSVNSNYALGGGATSTAIAHSKDSIC